jgi:uncharacterized protein Usg
MLSDLGQQLCGARLTTIEVFYRLPDHPATLQSFVWQTLDQAPGFPRLKRFLDFWEREIEGTLHSVTVATAGLVKPAELQYQGGELRLQ